MDLLKYSTLYRKYKVDRAPYIYNHIVINYYLPYLLSQLPSLQASIRLFLPGVPIYAGGRYEAKSDSIRELWGLICHSKTFAADWSPICSMFNCFTSLIKLKYRLHSVVVTS